MNDELLYRVALTFVKHVGPVTGRSLIEHFGDAKSVFNATLKDLKHVSGMNETKVKAFKEGIVFTRAEKELTYLLKHNVRTVWYADTNYPERLRLCTDAPLLMYYRGNTGFNVPKVIAIVGTRKSTEYGTKITEELIEGLSTQKDILIVSGLADGVDTKAHRAALANNIPTVGVLGHGHDMMYPANNKNLAKEMQINGGVLTEYPSETIADKGNFPARNRIVAGMSDVTVVVESDVKGGAMITAKIAGSYNRDVAAFPGRVGDKHSSGCNELIRTNIAAMITKADDLLELMNWGNAKPKTVQKQLFLSLSSEEKALLDCLAENDAVHADELYHKTGLGSSQLAATLLQLEMQGLVKALPGKMYRAN